MTRLGRSASRVLILALLLIAGGCGGLPKELHERAKRVDAGLVKAAADVVEGEKRFGQLLSSDAYAFAAPYAERENWSGTFTDVGRDVASARRLYDEELAPMLEENRTEDAEKAGELIARLKARTGRFNEQLKGPFDKARFLDEVRKGGAELVDAERQARNAFAAQLAGVAGKAKQAALDYPEKSEDLAGRVAAPTKRLEEIQAGLAAADAEWGGERDLANVAAAITGARESLQLASGERADLDRRAGELYRSYSKTLIDMEERPLVTVGRTSWDEYSDFARENEYRYPPVVVSPETAELLEKHGDRPLAANRSIRVPASVWQELGVDQQREFPRGDNAAEWWIADTDFRYLHRYALVEGSERSETDWQEVDEDTYEENLENLGMDILSKPYGLYEDEVIETAVPPGFAYVGNPKYGRWEDDGTGRRRWSWGQSFLFYYLVFGGPRHHYYHGGWNTWRNDYRYRKPYYGGGTYGSFGSATRNSSRYAGSAFGRSGGFNRQDRSIRGAGRAGRGGGPGSRGK